MLDNKVKDRGDLVGEIRRVFLWVTGVGQGFSWMFGAEDTAVQPCSAFSRRPTSRT